jgi:hypothetical protein
MLASDSPITPCDFFHATFIAPMWPPSHQRHDASCEEDDLYGYGGIVNEWGTIGLLLLEAAAERIVGDGALETWGVADKATRVKLCMLGEDLFVCVTVPGSFLSPSVAPSLALYLSIVFSLLQVSLWGSSAREITRAAPRGTCSRSASSIATSIVSPWLPSPFRYLPRHHERSSGSTGTKSPRIPSCHR